jgi:thiol-disulfide isomerase/thioredoxin
MSYANKGFCIDLHYGNPSNDALIKLYQTHKDFEQQWTFQRIDGNTSTSSTTGSHLPRLAEEPKLTKIPDGIYYIVNPGEGFPLTMKKSGNKYTLGLDKRLRDKTQQWKVTNNSDGSMTIRSVLNTNYVIMVKDGVMKPLIAVPMKVLEARQNLATAAERIYPGAAAPDFTLPTPDGRSTSLGSALDGKYLLLDFWGSWCPNCITGLPQMQQMYARYGDRLNILGIDCDETKEQWLSALARYSMPWLHVINDGDVDVAALYGVTGYPTKILIGPDGRIARRFIGESNALYNYVGDLFR